MRSFATSTLALTSGHALRDCAVKVGTGTFGRVRLVRCRTDGQYYALKMSKKTAIIRMKQVEHVKNEISLLAKVNHAAVVNLVGAFQVR